MGQDKYVHTCIGKHNYIFRNLWSHTDEFQLLVETGLLEGPTGGDISLATNPAPGSGHGGLFLAWKKKKK